MRNSGMTNAAKFDWFKQLLSAMAEDETGEEEAEVLRPKLNRLRELIECEDGLVVRTDDNFLLRYLRCCDYDPDVAFKRIKTYYSLKFEYPHWFAPPEPDRYLNEALNIAYFYLLPTKDREGKPIYVNELGYIKESKSTMPQESCLHDYYTEVMLDDEAIQTRGMCVLIDLKNLSWKLLKWLTPGNLKIAVKKTETLPVKKISYHVVNPNVVLSMALKVIVPCLSARTKENIHVHDETSSLHKMIDPGSLPTIYGGELDRESHKIKIDQNCERLKGNLQMGYKKEPKFSNLEISNEPSAVSKSLRAK